MSSIAMFKLLIKMPRMEDFELSEGVLAYIFRPLANPILADIMLNSGQFKLFSQNS
jgi:hypothetical protein